MNVRQSMRREFVRRLYAAAQYLLRRVMSAASAVMIFSSHDVGSTDREPFLDDLITTGRRRCGS
ncbi:hypothetical protein [Rhodopseudomonas sp. AAP120]|uniref:hypothetical protein n=1 Tax=Rhodopseudomonas sp. AAP120 TaxID=1523430 RepID=UPI000B0A6ECA|nr:hypothetical protein [Rhodopseudomonas sp. AAP120]